MKFTKPTGDSLIKYGALGGGGVLGAMLSDGAVGAVAPKTKNKTLIRAGVLVVSTVAAASISGNGVLDNLVKGACIGMAVEQGVKVVRENIQKVLPQNDGKPLNKFLHDAFGNGASLPIPEAVKKDTAALNAPFMEDSFLMAAPEFPKRQTIEFGDFQMA